MKNMYLGSPSDPSQTAAEQGVVKLRILDFKTTWSEFQKPFQTAAKRGVAELRIFNFKTTWSEFQKASHLSFKELPFKCFSTSPESVQSSCVR